MFVILELLERNFRSSRWSARYFKVGLIPKFRHVISSIIEAKDLATLTADDLSCSLKGHEGRLDMETNQVEVKAFHIRGEASISSPTANTGRGRGSGGFKGCSRDRGKGCVSKQKEAQTEGRQNKAHIQCYNCKKYRRYKS